MRKLSHLISLVSPTSGPGVVILDESVILKIRYSPKSSEDQPIICLTVILLHCRQNELHPRTDPGVQIFAYWSFYEYKRIKLFDPRVLNF